MEQQERQEIELLQDALTHKGIELLVKDIKANLEAEDTVIGPADPNMLLMKNGYCTALSWVIDTIKHYQEFEFEND